MSLGTIALSLLFACESGKLDFGDDSGGGSDDGGSGDGGSDDGGVGQGPEPDSRLIADVITWPCGSAIGETAYLGSYAFTTTLEYAPDGLLDFELPEPGSCAGGLSMFPQDAGSEGADIDADEGGPRWVTSWDSGPMERVTPGFYQGDIFGNQHSCQATDALLKQGLSIEQAGELTGVTSPAAGSLDYVVVSDEKVASQGLAFGDLIQLQWGSAGWESSWVQIRMERDGYAYDSVTCNTTGLESFELTPDIWELLDSEMSVELINLYVGFENTDVQVMESGLEVDILTRAMYVGVIQD